MADKVSPGAILRALDYLESCGVEMHSLLIARGGDLVFESYWAPWTRDTLHRMYSVTKSFVSMAVGCMEHDGLVSLDDRIASYFPEYPDLPPELSALSIRDMLMMRTCHSSTTYKMGCNPRYIPSWKDDWIGSFFMTAPDHAPGSVFIYDTSASHVLASLVERATGEEFMAYIRRKFLSSLSVSQAAYIMKDPKGCPIGGSGLMMRPLDLMSVLLFFSKGMGGLIGQDYMKSAVSPLSSVPDGRFSGYGYLFWVLPDGSYAMYGMGGQYAFYCPSSDIAIVTTAAAQGTKGGEEAILHAIRSIAGCGCLDGDAHELAVRCSSLHVPFADGCWNIAAGKREYVFDGRTGLESISFEFGDDGGTVEAVYYGRRFVIPFGYRRNVVAPFPVTKSSPAASSGAFLPDGTFFLLSHLMNEEIGRLTITASFSADGVTVLPHLHGEFSFLGFEGAATGKLIRHLE